MKVDGRVRISEVYHLALYLFRPAHSSTNLQGNRGLSSWKYYFPQIMSIPRTHIQTSSQVVFLMLVQCENNYNRKAQIRTHKR